MMNERLLLKLLLALFSGLIAAELLVVALFGFRLELMLFCFILAVALTGILVVVSLLGQQRPEIDSVSARRAKAKSSDVMRDRLKDYGVDEEFLGGGGVARQQEGVRDVPKPEGREAGDVVIEDSALEGHSMERESFDEYIHRCMNGGGEDLDCADGFSVELGSAARSSGLGTPPEDFSHDPKSAISRLKRAGEKS
ncbi:MAG: hypothetical protein ACOYLR_05800 [Chlorobium sp.]